MAQRDALTVGKEEEKLLQQKRQCCSVPALISICTYAVSGPLIIMVNKTIIKDHGLHAPALVSSMGILFTGATTHIAAACGLVQITPLGDSIKTATVPIVMVGVCTSLSFLLGNKAYVYLDPGFLQMMKAATPALLMFALILFRVEKITLGVSLCSLVMVGGSIMAALHSPHINAIGVAIQLSSQFCEVGQNVLIQFFLQRLSFTAMDAGYYIAPMSTLCCLILACSLESEIVKEDGGQLLLSQIPWLCASGLVGVAVNFSSFFVIQYISSLMAKLIVVARSAGLVTVLIVVWHEEWKPLQLVGYAITLVAFGGYSALKAKESKAAQSSKAETEMTQSGGARSIEDGQGDRQDEPLMMGTNPSAALR